VLRLCNILLFILILVFIMNVEQKEKIIKNRPEEVLAMTLYGEARGAPYKAKLGMARVMMNRVKDGRFGSSIEDVVTKPKQFSCYNDGDPNLDEILIVADDFEKAFDINIYLRDCYNAAMTVLSGKDDTPVKESLYYHTDKVNPKWNKKLKLEAKIGNTLFWKE